MKQMNYEEFEQYVKENLKILLPEAYADFDIVIREVRRPGYSYHGLMLTGKEEGCGVIVDLDHYYQEYRKPVPISKIMLSIASMVQEHIPDVEFGVIREGGGRMQEQPAAARQSSGKHKTRSRSARKAEMYGFEPKGKKGKGRKNGRRKNFCIHWNLYIMKVI